MKRHCGSFATFLVVVSGMLTTEHAVAKLVDFTGDVFKGVDLKANSLVTEVPLKARADFWATLSEKKPDPDGLTAAFSSNPQSPPTTFDLFSGKGSLVGSSTRNKLTNNDCDDVAQTCNGRFDTTGDTVRAWWESAVSFDVLFTAGNEVSAFGFYATDVGDFVGSLSLTLTDSAGDTSVLPVSSGGVDGAPGGALLFFGFTDTRRLFTSITFNINQTGATDDYFGFDDFDTGPLRSTVEPVPEPATLALVAASLAALAATRRRRRY